MAENWWLYLLECRGGSIYVGIAKDVEKRYDRHRRGAGAKYTQIHPPLRILAQQPYPSYGAARRAELLVKRLKPELKKEWANFIAAQGYSYMEVRLASLNDRLMLLDDLS